jgi:hypothetical protein
MEVAMRIRQILALSLLAMALSSVTFAITGDGGAMRQSAIVNFGRPTWVASALLMGTYVVVHDDGRMSRGEPCTVLYRVGVRRRPLEEAVAFHCIPHEGRVVQDFTTTVERNSIGGADALLDYQFAGDSEVHGVPLVALASNGMHTRAPEVCLR